MITEYPQGTKYLDSVTGLITSVKGMDNHAAAIDYLDMIGIGAISGHSLFRGWGERSSLSTSVNGDDVWQGTATTLPIPDQSTGEQMTVVSTSVQDGVAGTGILTLKIHGLDISGNEVSETVTMNGTTSVDTIRTNWRFNQSIHTQTVGANGVAVGTITIYKTGSSATVYNQINAGGNMSLNAARMVPSGKTFYLKGLSACASSNKPISIKLRATSDFEDIVTTGYFFLFKTACFLMNSTCVKLFPIPLKFTSLCIIKATAYSSQTGGDIAFAYDGWIE